MDVDLKDLIAQVLTPDVARQLASTVGMDDRQGKTFVDAAIPALVAAFVGALGRPDGARALSDAVSNSDPNGIEKLKRALAARDLQPLSEGANALSPVLGQGVRDKLANDLANVVDTPVEAAMPALGAIEQVAVAVIGQQDPSLWSDADSIKNLLAGQKTTISAAVPPSVAAEAAAPSAPPPPPPPPPPRPAPAPVAAPAASAAPPPPRTAPPPPPPPPPSGSWTWLIILIIVIIVAAAGYYYWKSTQDKPAAGFLPSSTEYTFGQSSETST
jgi:hypothetical protein